MKCLKIHPADSVAVAVEPLLLVTVISYSPASVKV